MPPEVSEDFLRANGALQIPKGSPNPTFPANQLPPIKYMVGYMDKLLVFELPADYELPFQNAYDNLQWCLDTFRREHEGKRSDPFANPMLPALLTSLRLPFKVTPLDYPPRGEAPKLPPFHRDTAKLGDTIEFLDDHLTDKGPATATIWGWSADGFQVHLQFADEIVTFPLVWLATYVKGYTTESAPGMPKDWRRPLWTIGR